MNFVCPVIEHYQTFCSPSDSILIFYDSQQFCTIVSLCQVTLHPFPTLLSNTLSSGTSLCEIQPVITRHSKNITIYAYSLLS